MQLWHLHNEGHLYSNKKWQSQNTQPFRSQNVFADGMDNSMIVEVKVVIDTEKPKDEKLVVKLVEILEDLREQLDD